MRHFTQNRGCRKFPAAGSFGVELDSSLSIAKTVVVVVVVVVAAVVAVVGVEFGSFGVDLDSSLKPVCLVALWSTDGGH